MEESWEWKGEEDEEEAWTLMGKRRGEWVAFLPCRMHACLHRFGLRDLCLIGIIFFSFFFFLREDGECLSWRKMDMDFATTRGHTFLFGWGGDILCGDSRTLMIFSRSLKTRMLGDSKEDFDYGVYSFR